jgi:putative nucleotidyltransferase with HDIG domain
MYKVLLVDDEPELLMSMASRLEVAKEFTVDCVSEGYEAALKVINTSYDCIFLDIMMPRLDGLDICHNLRSNPETTNIPIIITTALSDEATVHKAIRAGASDYLVKPFQGNLLIEKARKWTRHKKDQKAPGAARVVSLFDDTGEKTGFHKPKSRMLEKIFKKLAKPLVLAREERIVGRINEILRENGDVLPTVDILAADLMTAADIFRLANSAFIGAHSRVVGLSDAVRRLGLKTVHECISRCVAGGHKTNPTAQRFIRSGFWSHCLATACLAEEISLYVRACDREESYTAGLYHDIGKLFFISYFPDIYMDIIIHNHSDGLKLSQRERSVFSIDHGQLGCLILRKWHFPRIIQEACLHCRTLAEKDENTAFPTVAQITSLANTLSHMLLDEHSDYHSTVPARRLENCFKKLNLPLEKILKSACCRVENVAAQLRITSNLNIENALKSLHGDSPVKAAH